MSARTGVVSKIGDAGTSASCAISEADPDAVRTGPRAKFTYCQDEEELQSRVRWYTCYGYGQQRALNHASAEYMQILADALQDVDM